MKPVLAFTQGADHPSGRLRIAAYEKQLSTHGWQLSMHHFAKGMGKSLSPSAAWWQRGVRRLHRNWQTRRAVQALGQIPPEQPIIISRELPVHRHAFLDARNPLVLDVDDALYLGAGRDRLIELCRRAQAVICGNRMIADNLEPFSRRYEVIPTVVDVDQYAVRTDYRLTGRLRVGWLGSSMSLNETLLPWLEMMMVAGREWPFELVIISDEPPRFMSRYATLSFLKWSPPMECTIANHFDVGLMPLQNIAAQAAKCGAKILQYMAAGLPVIASPIGVNRELVVDGITGFLADNAGDWRQALQVLADQEALRRSMGHASRARVVTNYSITCWVDRWAMVLNEISR